MCEFPCGDDYSKEKDVKRPKVTLREFVNKDPTAEFKVPELLKMSYSRRIILMKGIGGLKSRKRTPTSTNIVFDNSLPQRLLTKKRKRIYKIVRQKSNGNKLSSIVFFIFLLLLLLKIIHSCDLRETLADNENNMDERKVTSLTSTDTLENP